MLRNVLQSILTTLEISNMGQFQAIIEQVLWCLRIGIK
jgi:hypothetical protein